MLMLAIRKCLHLLNCVIISVIFYSLVYAIKVDIDTQIIILSETLWQKNL